MQTMMTTTIQTVQPPTSGMTMMMTTVIARTAAASVPTATTMTMTGASMPKVNAAIVPIMTVPTDEALAPGEALVRSGIVGRSVVPTGRAAS